MVNSISSLPGGSEEPHDFYHYSHGMVYRFDANNGKLIWQTPVSSGNRMRLYAVNDVVYAIGTFDVDAVNAKNGERLWHVRNASEKEYFQSAIGNGRIYLYSLDQTFSALNPTDGSLLWHNTTFTTGSGYEFSVRNGHLYTERNTNRGMDYTLFRLDGATGEVRWSVSMPQASLLSKPLVEDGVVYIAAREFLFALNEQSGEIIWQQAVPNTLLHHPSLANGILYAESPALNNMRWSEAWGDSELPHIVALDARTGYIQWVIGPSYARVSDHNQVSLPLVDGLLLASYGEFEPMKNTRKPEAPIKFQGTGRGGLVGLDAQTGKVALSYPLRNVAWGSILHGTLSLLECVDLSPEAGSFRARRDFFFKSVHPRTGQIFSSHLLATGESMFHVFGIGNGLLYRYLPAPTTGPYSSSEYSIVAYRLSDGSRAWGYEMPPRS